VRSARSSGAETATAQCETLRRENRKLRRELRSVRADRDRLAKEVDVLKTQKAALAAKLEDARRAGKRQAAPFAKDRRTARKDRKRPGRKAGIGHGRHGHRQPPAHVDDERVASLPAACPHCGCGEIEPGRSTVQYQDELVTAVVRRRYRIETGRCRSCRRAVHGRHPDQTSNAAGAAGTMLGPRVLALACWLHYGCGVSAAKIARLFSELGLSVSAGGITQGLLRMADDTTGTYQGLLGALRASGVVSPDETSWRIDGERGWLWVFVGDTVTVYEIAIGEGARSYEVAKEVLGEDFAGVLCRDGWAPYRSFEAATHQTCVAHLLRRADEMIADAKAGQARVPHALRRLLHDALALRDKRDAGKIGAKRLKAEVNNLEERADKLLAARVTYEPNRRLLGHLANEREALFTFLRHPGTPATNHNAERAIRPFVCTRKNWGGNKSLDGAAAAAMIGSVLRTATQQGANPIEVLASLATTDGARSGLDLSTGRGP
jgi:transposase